MSWQMLAVNAIPAVAQVALNVLASPQQTQYQRSLTRLADILQKRIETPVVQNQAVRQALTELEAQDIRRRQTSKGATSRGATDEAVIAANANANVGLGIGMGRILGEGIRQRDQAIGQYASVIGEVNRSEIDQQQRFADMAGKSVEALAGAVNGWQKTKTVSETGV